MRPLTSASDIGPPTISTGLIDCLIDWNSFCPKKIWTSQLKERRWRARRDTWLHFLWVMKPNLLHIDWTMRMMIKWWWWWWQYAYDDDLLQVYRQRIQWEQFQGDRRSQRQARSLLNGTRCLSNFVSFDFCEICRRCLSKMFVNFCFIWLLFLGGLCSLSRSCTNSSTRASFPSVAPAGLDLEGLRTWAWSNWALEEPSSQCDFSTTLL